MSASNLDLKKIGIAVGGLLALLLLISLVLFLRGGEGGNNEPQGGTFGTAPDLLGGAAQGSSETELPIASDIGSSTLSAIFKIADGPVIAATLIQATNPTTTIARYVSGQNGHVIDLPLDVPGAAPRIVSNSTIPGVTRGIWTDGGRGVVLQYLDDGVVKSAHLSLAAASSTPGAQARAAAIRFLPDNLVGLAPSPDGKRIAYLLRTGSGVDGYLSASDGAGAEKLFSLPLSQLILTWPASGVLLAYQKSAVGAPGIAFSINARTGVATPILYGFGLTAIGSPSMSHVYYQTNDGNGGTSYISDTRSGAQTPASSFPFSDAFPEQCAWSALATTTLYCAAHQGAVPADYADRWHRGEASVADALLSLDILTGESFPLALPGIIGGGELSDIIELSVAPDDRYLSFIAKDTGAAWAVRLRTDGSNQNN